MCGFEATNLPATNVQKHVGLQSTQNVDKVARLPENLRADVTNRELRVSLILVRRTLAIALI